MRDPQKAARHVAYELGMFRETFGSLPATGPIPVVMLETFLVHTRNLIEFFWDGSPGGAILPKDFGAPTARDKDATWQGLRDAISQLVSHLTWDRVDHELRPQDWSYSRLKDIHDDVRAKAERFFATVPRERHSWFTAEFFPKEYEHWAH